MSNPNTSEQESYCHDNSNMMKPLDTVQTIPVSEPNYRKCKTCCSSVGNCFHKADTHTGLDTHFKKRHSPSESSDDKMSIADSNKGERNWGVHDAMHSCPENDNISEDWIKTHPSQCSVTPMYHSSMGAQRKEDQLQSSWNVLGVKPLDYSSTPKEP